MWLRRDVAGMRRYFTAAGLLTFVFLIGQTFAWQQLYASGQFDVSSPAFSFFVLLTAVHGLHLVGGLVVWTRTAGKLHKDLEQASLVEIGVRSPERAALCHLLALLADDLASSFRNTPVDLIF